MLSLFRKSLRNIFKPRGHNRVLTHKSETRLQRRSPPEAPPRSTEPPELNETDLNYLARSLRALLRSYREEEDVAVSYKHRRNAPSLPPILEEDEEPEFTASEKCSRATSVLDTGRQNPPLLGTANQAQSSQPSRVRQLRRRPTIKAHQVLKESLTAQITTTPTPEIDSFYATLDTLRKKLSEAETILREVEEGIRTFSGQLDELRAEVENQRRELNSMLSRIGAGSPT